MKKYRKLLYLFTLLFMISGCAEKNRSDTSKSEHKIDLAEYEEKGEQLANSTKKVLVTNLVQAIEEKGTEHALEFCNIEAIPLTDSMSVTLNAHIKRVTDQPRNPDNKANEEEMAIIKRAKNRLQNEGDVSPEINQMDHKVVAYYPLVTNQLCMQCHGSESADINEATLSRIKEFYPEDEATGYKLGELRGLLVVEMEID